GGGGRGPGLRKAVDARRVGDLVVAVHEEPVPAQLARHLDPLLGLARREITGSALHRHQLLRAATTVHLDREDEGARVVLPAGHVGAGDPDRLTGLVATRGRRGPHRRQGDREKYGGDEESHYCALRKAAIWLI